MSLSVSHNAVDAPSVSLWETHAPNCGRDLILKKMAVVFIALTNLAALSTALYFIVTYCPVSSHALVISPFITGVLGALSYLKFPTCGVNDRNYSNYINPTALIGKGLAYLFFGPLMLAVKYIDWTPYHDPLCATRISNDLKELPFDQIERKYGDQFSNLVDYGFISKESEEHFYQLRKAHQPVKDAIDFWREEKMEKSDAYAQAEKIQANLEEDWQRFKQEQTHPFPSPALPHYDFTQSTTRIELWIRNHFSFNKPIDITF